jgi:hypothetical protein
MNIDSQAYEKLYDQVWDQLWEQVRLQVWYQARSSVFTMCVAEQVVTPFEAVILDQFRQDHTD